MLALRDTATLTQALRDKGFGRAEDGSEAPDDMEQLLQRETESLWKYLERLLPASDLYKPFLLRNDYHNIKAVIKGVVSGRDYHALLLQPSTVEVREMEEAVKERSFGRLPSPMGEAAASAYDMLTHTADVQSCDAILDKAAMQDMLACAAATQQPLLIELIQAMVAYCNFKIALRAARAGKSAEFLRRALCDLPQLSVSSLVQCAAGGVEKVLEYMEQKDLFGSRAAAEQFRKSPSAFEKAADDIVMQIARKGRMQAMGAAPILGYLVARETEIKVLHILFSGVRAGQPEQSIRERLRELYV